MVYIKCVCFQTYLPNLLRSTQMNSSNFFIFKKTPTKKKQKQKPNFPLFTVNTHPFFCWRFYNKPRCLLKRWYLERVPFQHSTCHQVLGPNDEVGQASFCRWLDEWWECLRTHTKKTTSIDTLWSMYTCKIYAYNQVQLCIVYIHTKIDVQLLSWDSHFRCVLCSRQEVRRRLKKRPLRSHATRKDMAWHGWLTS